MGGDKRRREIETEILSKVGDISSAIESAKDFGEVCVTLHSLAVRLFSVDSAAVASNVHDSCSGKVLDDGALLPSNAERDEWRDVFYRGSAFPAMSKLLLYNVATKWLPHFPFPLQQQLYDSFFVRGLAIEILEALVPCLQHKETIRDIKVKSVCSNVERLLVLCLLENEGVYQIVREFGIMKKINGQETLLLISRVAQLLASIPDKSRHKSSVLSSHLFFQKISIQLLLGAEASAEEVYGKVGIMNADNMNLSFLFVGEVFSRIIRRGSADILLSEVIPKILCIVRSCISSEVNSIFQRVESNPRSQFWFNLMEAVKDQYAIERFSEELLRQLATLHVNDMEAYWVLWMLFHNSFSHQIVIRTMFVDKFTLWKVFPFCCLRWILQFSLLKKPPNAGIDLDGQKAPPFLETVQRMVGIWSKREFVQSATMEQQTYVTAAVGWCLERMSKEELESTKDVLNSILQGVSCRLESPLDLVRRMASSIALVFSRAVDPKNPLYLDDNHSDNIDWELGLISQRKQPVAPADISERNRELNSSSKEKKLLVNNKGRPDAKEKVAQNKSNGKAMISEIRLDDSVDSTGIHDSTDLICGDNQSYETKDDDNHEDYDSSSVSSLEPYDLSDDDTDLQKKIAQLGDISAALRKTDDPESVEIALANAERLVRASPDELNHMSGDLVSALVHVRCSDVAIEGKEDSAENERQKALIALLVMCPFESLGVLTKLLYSPNLDVSQRILIIDVMTDAAHELADAETMTIRHHQRDLISNVSGGHPWFLPGNRGPPGAGPWRASVTESSLSWTHRYERVVPSRSGHTRIGKPLRWNIKKENPKVKLSKNRFPLYAAAFMLPVMTGFDKRLHGVDLLNRDFIVLGKLIYMLGTCMKCIAMHPEASALAPALLDMIRSRDISNHVEAFVRRSMLFAASCILASLHPSYVASALIEGNQEISQGLEWIRTWALHLSESDPDVDCSTMAMACLQRHAEMALQVSRVLESATSSKEKFGTRPIKLNDIVIPSLNSKLRI